MPVVQREVACRCAPGHYCPSTGEQIVCPKGHFCPEQSMQPTRCVLLAPCPEGTAHPPLSFVLLLFVVMSALVMLAFWLHVLRVARIQQQRAADAGKHEVLNMVRTLLARLQKAYGDDVRLNSTLVEPIVRLEFRHLGMTLRSNGKSVLANVSGVYQPGHLHAVMGPSGSGATAFCSCLRRRLHVRQAAERRRGAGKTTFLNALAGRAPYGVQMGEVCFNGEVHAPAKVKGLFGFVPQDDIVHQDLTVLENVMMAHALRVGFQEVREDSNVVYEVRVLITTRSALLPPIVSADWPGASTRPVAACMQVLDDLYLTRVKHSIVGSVEQRGISGGQRKRVNIALEVRSLSSVALQASAHCVRESTSAWSAIGSHSR